VLKSRKPVALVILLWLTLLALPMGRTNLALQAFQPGPDFTDRVDPGVDLAGNRVTKVPSSLPNLEDLLDAKPDDRDLHLAAAAGAKEDELVQLDLMSPKDAYSTVLLRHKQIQQLDALIERHPRDAALIAIRLTAASQGLRIGRYDSPLFNANWPGPNLHKPDWADQPSPAANWQTFLELANRGAALEPNNTFFDWMRMAGLLALHRDAEALRVLNLAALKTGYDDHRRDEIFGLLRAYGEARPLTAAEQTQLVDDTFEGRSEHFDVAYGVMGAVVEARLAGKDQTALTEAYNLFRLCRVFRIKSYDLSGPVRATFLEKIATRWVVPMIGAPSHSAKPKAFSSLAQFSIPMDLTSYALAMRRLDIAVSIHPELKITLKWTGPAEGVAEDYNPYQRLEDVLATQERWGRILLQTLPPVLILWGWSALVTARWKFEDESQALPPRRGAAAGALILALLAAGDAALAWRLQPGTGATNLPDYPHSTTLYALAPVLVTVGTAGCLVIMSFAGARRWQLRNRMRPPLLVQIKAAIGSPDRLSELSLTPLIGAVATATVWGVLAFAFANLCANPQVSPGGDLEVLYDDNNALPWLVWLAFLAVALVRWCRLPDRRRALALVVLNLRRVTAGYLLAALLLYAVTALLTVPVALHFDAKYRAYLQVGQNVTVHQKFGL